MANFVSPYQFNTANGTVMPDTSTIKGTVQDTFKEIFGEDIDLNDTTPIGRFVDALTDLMSSTVNLTAANANQFNIDYATGSYLDSIGALFNVYRNPATQTTVILQFTRKAEFATQFDSVPAGTIVENSNGNQFITISDAVFDNSGLAFIEAVSTTDGPVIVDANTVNRLVSVLDYVSSVNNSNPGNTGLDAENDSDYRIRIKNSRGLGSASVESIRTKILSLPGVKSCYVEENENGTETDQSHKGEALGVTMPPHSILVCVDEGDEDQIAQAIFETKTAGASYTNDTENNAPLVSKIVQYNNSEYEVYFYSSVSLNATATIKIKRSDNTDYTDDITEASKSYFDKLTLFQKANVFDLAQYILNNVPGNYIITSITINNGNMKCYNKLVLSSVTVQDAQ